MNIRRSLIAGNWKMNLNINKAVELINAIAAIMNEIDEVDVLVAPPFTMLPAVRKAIGSSGIFLGAQNMHQDMSGALTGEISGRMLQDVGCTHVILGHSERRGIFQETDEIVNLKVKAALVLGLIPIICIGETLAERDA